MSTLKRLAICFLLTVLAATVASSQQSKPQSNSDVLDTRIKRLFDYEQDFIEFTKSNRNNTNEYEIARELVTVARESSDLVDAASSLLFVYDNITSKADRATVSRFIESKLSTYVQMLDLSIKQINLQLSYTKSVGIAASGTRLKEELRDIKSLLESIRL